MAPLKEAVKPEPQLAKLCERVWDACWNYALDVVTPSQDDLERRSKEIKAALTEYADTLKEQK